MLLVFERGSHLRTGVVALLFLGPSVHNMHNVVDGDGSFGNVGRQDDFALALWGALEHSLLVGHRHTGVHCGKEREKEKRINFGTI